MTKMLLGFVMSEIKELDHSTFIDTLEGAMNSISKHIR